MGPTYTFVGCPVLPDVPESVATGGGILATLGALLMAFRKGAFLWRRDGRDIAAVDAHATVITLLREELERSSQRQQELSSNVDTLNDLVTQLRTQLAEFQVEVTHLHAEISRLRGEDQA